MKVIFLHNGRERPFRHCDDLEDAKVRFQWAYGYWPEDIQVREIEEDEPVKEASNEQL